MFSKKFRLPIREFKQCSPKNNYSASCFNLKTCPNKVGRNRFGTVIGISAEKKSTRRHYWKRCFADYLSEWPNLGLDFLFIVSPKIREIDKEVLGVELEKILTKVAKDTSPLR